MPLWEQPQPRINVPANIFIIYSKQSVGYREKAIKQWKEWANKFLSSDGIAVALGEREKRQQAKSEPENHKKYREF